MDAMVGRRVEDPVEETELADQFGVHPELIQGGNGIDRQDRLRLEAEQGQRQHEQEVQGHYEQVEAHRHREVVLLRRVMGNVKRPHEAAAVAETVEHVVDEVVDHHQEHPRNPRHPHVQRGKAVQESEQDQEDNLHGRCHEQITEREGKICRGVPEFVRAQVVPPADRGLDGDQREEADGDDSFQAHAARLPALLQRLWQAAFKRVTVVTHRKLRGAACAGQPAALVPARCTTAQPDVPPFEPGRRRFIFTRDRRGATLAAPWSSIPIRSSRWR